MKIILTPEHFDSGWSYEHFESVVIDLFIKYKIDKVKTNNKVVEEICMRCDIPCETYNGIVDMATIDFSMKPKKPFFKGLCDNLSFVIMVWSVRIDTRYKGIMSKETADAK